jgi:hypothetical protein
MRQVLKREKIAQLNTFVVGAPTLVAWKHVPVRRKLWMASQGEAEMHNILVSLAVTVLLLSPIGIVACLKRPPV